MVMNIVINGMGRIGRMVLWIVLNNKNLNVKVINVSYLFEIIVYLFNYDMMYGVYDKKVELIESGIKVNGYEIKLFFDCNLENLLWNEMDIDVVIEVIGKFNYGDKVVVYINVGVKKVLFIGLFKGGDV